LALNHETGGLEWYFQFTPHDVHDWDAIQVPVLADLVMDGVERKVMMWANRNAFFYTLDRKTGEFLVGTPFARQTWAEGLDSNGRPIRVPNTSPTAEGTLVSPPVVGGTNWFSPAYSPRTELFYVQAFDGEDVYFQRDEEYSEGDQFTGGGFQMPLPIENYESAVRAIDPKTGDIRWEYEIQPRSTAGMLATAGDLVFSGTVDGYFFALDAVSGEELWHVNVGNLVHSAPMSYAVDGRQYVTIAAGNVVFTFGLRE
jgi:alcohol dehydrogenase (cytochrome c)